jgi:hypothetical protein
MSSGVPFCRTADVLEVLHGQQNRHTVRSRWINPMSPLIHEAECSGARHRRFALQCCIESMEGLEEMTVPGY